MPLIKLEITRTLRNKKFMFFSVIYPAVLFLVIAGTARATARSRAPSWACTPSTWSPWPPSAR